jgi:hypothetical protein
VKTVTLTDEEYEVLVEYRKKQNLRERLIVLKKNYRKKIHELQKICDEIENITEEQKFYNLFFNDEDSITFNDLVSVLRDYEGSNEL